MPHSRTGSSILPNDTAVGSSHISAKLDNTFYADKLAGLRRKILNIQSKHDQTINNTITEPTIEVQGNETSRSRSRGRAPQHAEII